MTREEIVKSLWQELMCSTIIECPTNECPECPYYVKQLLSDALVETIKILGGNLDNGNLIESYRLCTDYPDGCPLDDDGK